MVEYSTYRILLIAVYTLFPDPAAVKITHLGDLMLELTWRARVFHVVFNEAYSVFEVKERAGFPHEYVENDLAAMMTYGLNESIPDWWHR